MPSDRRRRLFLRALPVAVIGAAALAWARAGSTELPDPVRARIDDLVLEVEVEGELAAVRSAEIGPPPSNEWEFKISFLAPEGSEVKEGDPLIRFDVDRMSRLLAQKKAEAAEAQQKLEQKQTEQRLRIVELDQQIAEAETELGRARLKADVPREVQQRVEAEKAVLDRDGREKDLANLKAQRRARLARGKSDEESAKAQLDRARGRVAELEAGIERMTVRARQDGILLYKSNWRGEKKKVGDNVWRGETVLSIPDLTEMRADATVDESDGGRVSEGQPVRLRLEARPDLDLRGTVRSIARTVRRKSARVPAKVFKVDIALEATESGVMRPAMRFRGDVEVGRLAARLVAPREVVFLRDTGPVVFRRGWLGWRETPVKLGETTRKQVEILEGVAEGDALLPYDLAAPEPSAPSGPTGPASAG